MNNDNTTPLAASDFDAKVNQIMPFYSEFYNQALDVIEQFNFSKIDWLDLGCGTGAFEKLAIQRLSNVSDFHFVLVDPAEKMLELAQEKLKDYSAQYLCISSASIDFENRFDVVTAIQSHHYLHEEERKEATKRLYRALKKGGLYVCFEIIVPEDEEIKAFEFQRWGRYQQRQGRTEEVVKEHLARCGVHYFPITVDKHVQLLKDVGFQKVYVFWRSYMNLGIYGIK